MSILRLKDENGNWQDVPAIIGPQGEPGKDGDTGADGKSAYQIWLDAGNTGTEADFLASLIGPQGPEGELPDLSAYVKFVNGVGPDENGNVLISGETEDVEVGFVILTQDKIDYIREQCGMLSLSSPYNTGAITTALIYKVYGPGVYYFDVDFRYVFDNWNSQPSYKKGSYLIVGGSGSSSSIEGIWGIMFAKETSDFNLQMHTYKYPNLSDSTLYKTTTNTLYERVDMAGLFKNLWELGYTSRITSDTSVVTKQYVDNTVTTALGDIESLLSEV